MSRPRLQPFHIIIKLFPIHAFSCWNFHHINDKMVFTVKDMSFKAGQELTVSGKANSGCEYFCINVGHDSDAIALHFNPRFCYNGDSNVIVCNSMQGGWGDEHREHSFPFQQGDDFKVTINFNNDQFYIKLSNGTMMSFPNRFGDDKFKYIDVQGNVKVQGIKIK